MIWIVPLEYLLVGILVILGIAFLLGYSGSIALSLAVLLACLLEIAGIISNIHMVVNTEGKSGVAVFGGIINILACCVVALVGYSVCNVFRNAGTWVVGGICTFAIQMAMMFIWRATMKDAKAFIGTGIAIILTVCFFAVGQYYCQSTFTHKYQTSFQNSSTAFYICNTDVEGFAARSGYVTNFWVSSYEEAAWLLPIEVYPAGTKLLCVPDSTIRKGDSKLMLTKDDDGNICCVPIDNMSPV